MEENIQITRAELSDEANLLELYKKVVKVPGGIIRTPAEITQDYVSDFLSKSIQNGLILVAKLNDQVIGEIHAYVPGIYAFQHILTELTIIVDPDHHGQGIGKTLFATFLKTVREDFDHILRVELYVREYNTRNVAFYEKLGFRNEGRQENKIFTSKSTFETPLHMAWFNPAYKHR